MEMIKDHIAPANVSAGLGRSIWQGVQQVSL